MNYNTVETMSDLLDFKAAQMRQLEDSWTEYGHSLRGRGDVWRHGLENRQGRRVPGSPFLRDLV